MEGRRTRSITRRLQAEATQQSREPTSSDRSQNVTAGTARPQTCQQDKTSATIDTVEIDEDDICPICQLLLCTPVITDCNHTLCKSCMATWADVSVSEIMQIVPVTEQPRDFDAATGLEARCPMCRTQTKASLDEARAETLRSKYPGNYAEREAEETENVESGDYVQTITVYIGNTHEVSQTSQYEEHQTHEWTYFVRPSRTDIIEEVQIRLHPTFRPNRIIRQRPPYELKRVGWGRFIITASVLLKAGYHWVSEEAVDSPDGVPQGLLGFDWTLDFSSFEGKGAMGRLRLKVRKDRDWDADSDEGERDDAEWNRMMRTYERDGRYEPPADD